MLYQEMREFHFHPHLEKSASETHGSSECSVAVFNHLHSSWTNVVTAITSICTIGWVGGYAVPIFARMVMAEKNFKPGPFYLGKARRPICLIAFWWICYTCSVFLLPTFYPITCNTFNYAPVALGVSLGLIMLWWFLDARKWFKGPVRNVDIPNGKV